jgi:hypothetical protein
MLVLLEQLDTLLCGSSLSPKCSASAMQLLTQAGVASGSTPGFWPFASPASTRSLQNVHLVATPIRFQSKVSASFSIGVPP